MSTNTLDQDLFSSVDTIDLSSINVDFASGATITGTNGANWSFSNMSDTITIGSVIQPQNTIQINGEGADILVNGESVMETLRGIQERLNMLRPNPELEAEWDQLRELGEQYRRLEAELKEKSQMWATLKRMPPPKAP